MEKIKDSIAPITGGQKCGQNATSLGCYCRDTPAPKFDLEEWAESIAEDCMKCTIREKDATVKAVKAGYLKAQEQFQAERERLWEAARETVTTGRNSTNWDGSEYDEGEPKYETLADYDAAQREE